MNISKLFCITLTAAVALFSSSSSSIAADKAAPASFEDIVKQAKESKTPILLEFTGSDWCPPCKMMKAQTFSKEEFKTFAAEKLTYVELDFPNSKPQSDEEKARNHALQNQFDVKGYPTLILLDSDGKELVRHVGFLQGGPEALINWVNQATKDS